MKKRREAQRKAAWRRGETDRKEKKGPMRRGGAREKKRENRPYRRIAATTASVVVAWPCSSVDCKIKRENEV